MERTIEGIAEGTAAPQIVDIRPWTRIPAGETHQKMSVAEAFSGRAVMYTRLSPSKGLSLFGTEFLFIEKGLAMQITATATVQQWQFLGPLLNRIAATVRLSGDATRAPDESPAPIPATATDRVASEAFGCTVEKIDGIVAAQPYEFDGAWVHGRTLEVLIEMADGLRVGVLNKTSYAEQLRELEALEFVEGTRLTELGTAVGAHLSEPQASYRITGLDSGGESWFQAWAHGPTALVMVEPGYHRLLDGQPADRPSQEHFNLQLAPLTMLSTLMACWVGLQPAWNLPLEPNPLPVDDLASGWTGNRTPPQSSNAAMQTFWDEPWFS